MSKDYIIQVKVKNGHLLRTMRDRGFDNAVALAKAAGISNGAVGGMLNLTVPPQTKDGRWHEVVLKAAETLRALPEDLFPPQHLRVPLEKNVGEVEATLEDVAAFIPAFHQDPQEALEEADKRRVLDQALATLPPRTADILRRRYGLDTGDVETYQSVGTDLYVGKERVRQIEANGLRKLRKFFITHGEERRAVGGPRLPSMPEADILNECDPISG